MDYLKFLKENDTPIGQGCKSEDSPIEYLEILENFDKPKLFIPLNAESSLAPKRSVSDNHIDYVKILTEQSHHENKRPANPDTNDQTQGYLEKLKNVGKAQYVEQTQVIHPDKVQEYLQSFRAEEDEEPPTSDNQVQEPEYKQLAESNIQLEIKTLKTQIESLGKKYGSIGGGGTNAMQFSNGGTMNGNLTVNGTVFVNSISAANYLGLSAAGGNYVRLTGDTMTGTLFAPSVSAYSLSAHVHDFSPDGTPAWREGRLFYDLEDHTLSLYTDISGVSLQVGQEHWIKAVNKTGAPILNGTPVYISGAQGNRPTIEKASSYTHERSTIIGLATHDIAINQTGVVTTDGLVRDVDTRDWPEGTVLYTSLTAGVLTDTQQPAPYHSTEVGIVIYQHNNQGIIYVNPVYGFEVQDLHDVGLIDLQDKQFLSYNTNLSSWINVSSDRRVQVKTSNYSLLSTDNTISFNISANTTVFLPPRSSFPNIQLEYTIKNKAQSISQLTLSAFDNELIDNSTSWIILPGDSLTIVHDTVDWIII